MTISDPLIFDLETDGLEATKVWCLHAVSQGRDEALDINVTQSTNVARDAAEALRGRLIICHNIIGFDGPTLNRLSGVEPLDSSLWIDTLILSKMFFPDIKAPKGVKGPHSLEAWGRRFKYPKPEHEDWSKYSPEMQVRVEGDVEINLKLYLLLIKKGWRLPDEL